MPSSCSAVILDSGRYGYGDILEPLHHIDHAAEFVAPAVGGGAVVENLDNGHPLVLDALGDQLVDLCGVKGGGPGDEGRAGADGQLADVEDRVGVAVGSRRGFGARGSGGGELAAGHAVDVVVEDDVGHVDVAPAGMDEMVPADGGAVAVAAHDDNRHFRFGHFDAGGKSGGATMGGMKGAHVDVAGKTAGAADTGNDGGIVLFQTAGIHGPDQALHGDAVAAAGAPDVGQFAGTDGFVVIVSHLFYLLDLVHDLARIDRLTVDAAEVENRAGALDDTLHFEVHLAEVHFRNHDRLDLACPVRQPASRGRARG